MCDDVVGMCQIADVRPSEKDHVVVMERRSGRVLTGPNAPTEAQLELWLQTHPSFEVVQPGVSSTNTYSSKLFLQDLCSRQALTDAHLIESDLPTLPFSAEFLPLDCTSFRYSAHSKIIPLKKTKAKNFIIIII